MKKLLAGVLIGTVMMGITVNGASDDAGNKQSVMEIYYEKAQEIQNTYGIPEIQDSIGTWYAKGLSALTLLDFDGDGIDDLLAVYCTGSKEEYDADSDLLQVRPEYRLEIWSAKDGGAELLYETETVGTGRNSYGVLYGDFVSIIRRESGGDVLQLAVSEAGDQKEIRYNNIYMDNGEINTDTYACGAGSFFKNNETVSAEEWVDDICGKDLIYFAQLSEYGYYKLDENEENPYDQALVRINSFMNDLSKGEAESGTHNEIDAYVYRKLLLAFDIYENHCTAYDYSDSEVGQFLSETLSIISDVPIEQLVDYQDIAYFDYAVYDLNKDGIPELIINKHVRHVDTECFVFTIQDGNICYCGSISVFYDYLYTSDEEQGIMEVFSKDRDNPDKEGFTINSGKIEEFMISGGDAYSHSMKLDYPKMLQQVLYFR